MCSPWLRGLKLGPSLGCADETAQFRRGARRRAGDAPRRACPTRNAGDRLSAFGLACTERKTAGGLSQGPGQLGLRRRPERRNRLSLGRRARRPPGGACRRAGPPAGVGDRDAFRDPGRARGQSRDRHDPDRFPGRKRSYRDRPGGQPQPARRQRNGREFAQLGSHAQAHRIAARGRAIGRQHLCARQSVQSERAVRGQRASNRVASTSMCGRR